jgi:dCTP deaminase
MILSQVDIRAAVERGEIGFRPGLEERQWGQASIDLRLGFQFTRLRKVRGVTISLAEGLESVGLLKLWDTKELREFDELGSREAYDLAPGEFILALTYESVKVPPNLIARVEGRSSYARMGLSMHQTAPWIQPGWDAPIVLEIANHGTLTIRLTPITDRPCQLTFLQLNSALPNHLAYGARPTDQYQHQQHPIETKKKKRPNEKT